MFRQSSRQEQADALFDPLGDPPSLFPWAPVALGLGICAFFMLRVEPPVWLLWGAFGLSVLVWGGLRWPGLPWAARPLVWAVILMALGFAVAGLRAHSVAAPVLSSRYYGPIEGRIIAIDVSGSDAVRLTLDQVFLGDTAPWRVPARVRISLHGVQGYLTPEPGQRVMTTGHLSPPQGPVEPYGFDFRRMAWFQQLGGVGYTRNPVLMAAPPDRPGPALWIYDQRLRLSHAIQDRLQGPRGAFASAIITGDRAGLDEGLVTALRHSNLAHLLAISGLHMGLLTGLVFFGLRAALALSPRVALHWPTRKIAACTALAVGAVYLAISGANIATQRAFIMVAVMFVAIVLDRRALSLRSVSMAALILLLWRPEAVLGAGFQMSFAATTALIVGFDAIRRANLPRLPKLLQAPGTVLASSLIAGLATAPFAAAHFNIIASYGLLANLLAVPAMGFVVMPGALLAAGLAPLGGAPLGLWIMGLGIDWILAVAQFVAGLEGGVRFVPMPGPVVLPLMVLGGLCTVLGPAKQLRLFGIAPILVSLLIWAGIQRPDILVSQSGALIGVRTPEGRVLSKDKGEGFAAENWLQNDGEIADQPRAYARSGFAHDRARSDWPDLWPDAASAPLRAIVQLRSKSAADQAPELCRDGVLLITMARLEGAFGPCTVLDADRLRDTGSVAISLRNDQLKWIFSNDISGARLWTERGRRAQYDRINPTSRP